MIRGSRLLPLPILPRAFAIFRLRLFVLAIAWFVVIFCINTTSDISKLLYVIRNLRQFWNIPSGIYAKYHEQIMLLFVYTTTRKKFVIFTCRYFKLSWNTTALSQSNCRNFLCSSIIIGKPSGNLCEGDYCIMSYLVSFIQQQQQQHQMLYLHDHKGITVLKKLLV